MASKFHPGIEIQRADIRVFFTYDCGSRRNVCEITYALYYVDPGPPEAEVLIGSPQRTPVNPEVGEYHPALFLPLSAAVGWYRLRWVFRKSPESLPEQIVMQFQVVRKLRSHA